ncbi:hypothetical protein ACP70R_028087 [Stipagrostis hirtigluma subsp. patula]
MPQQTPNEMDAAVDAMTVAYDALVDAVAAVLREPARVGLLIDFKHRLDAFSATCDHAQDLVRVLAARIAVSADFDVAPPASVSAKLDQLLLSAQAVVQGVQAHVAVGADHQQEGGRHTTGDKEENNGLSPAPPVVATAEAAEEAAEVVKEADLPEPAPVAEEKPQPEEEEK